ncbi:MAG: phosphate/phosphite/phosphonate ABC transporter substrate-binding protein [Gammaproteobacteria bacterium]|nr:phosphate/phosphite/phosphonate ABC transporter substrate-binding protein [Gammaproteobacteria bacterium]
MLIAAKRQWMALIVGLVFSSIATAEAKKEIILGSVAMDIPAVMYKRLTPLTDYLSTELGLPVTLKLSPNMGAAINEIADDKVDIAYLTPVAYLKAHKKGKSQIIAKTVTNGKASFQLMIVVKHDSPIKIVEDLAGKSFAFGDKKALLQRAAVVGSGIQLEKLGSYEFIGHYDNIANAVLHGDFDAGILKDTTAFKWEKKGLRILYASPNLPPYNIAVSKKVDPTMAAKIKKAFLALNKEDENHLSVIKALDKKYDGFADTSDEEYDVIRRLIKPFNK